MRNRSANRSCENTLSHEHATITHPDDATTLALCHKILADIQDYYAHIQSQTDESKNELNAPEETPDPWPDAPS